MGETCSRLDCSAVDDCTTSLGKKHYVFWYDCANQVGQCPKVGSHASLGAEAAVAPEGEVQLTVEEFAISRSSGGAGSEASRGGWSRRYMVGRELGAGQTAVVFEAFSAPAPGLEDLPVDIDSGAHSEDGSALARKEPLGRRVALKRFNSNGSMMFRQEVRALLAVGVHPHVLRLLESFDGGPEADALVLEYCEGGDAYDLYASNNGCGMSEHFVVALMKQLLLALDHLGRCGVEHRDVKPENLLLYGPPPREGEAPHLKLADFGWAATTRPAVVPAEGVGSLWYAPPELNPPVEGVEVADASVGPIGRSDMWSVGIITYLLLVGHSPFNPALRIPEVAAREAEVLRLAALGQINNNTRAWSRLSKEARSFVTALVQPKTTKRLTARQAWSHPFVARRPSGGREDAAAPLPRPPELEERQRHSWRGLDGLQRLCWLAVARAVTEPELLEGATFRALISRQQMGCPPYLERLAAELALAAAPAWLQPQSAWGDVLCLAFRYLDADSDGLLGAQDLARHVLGGEATETARVWVLRWQQERDTGPTQTADGLGFLSFRTALWSSVVKRCAGPAGGGAGGGPAAAEGGGSSDERDDGGRHRPPARPPSPKGTGVAAPGPGAEEVSDTAEELDEGVMRRRMQAIEEVCLQFVTEDDAALAPWL